MAKVTKSAVRDGHPNSLAKVKNRGGKIKMTRTSKRSKRK